MTKKKSSQAKLIDVGSEELAPFVSNGLIGKAAILSKQLPESLPRGLTIVKDPALGDLVFVDLTDKHAASQLSQVKMILYDFEEYKSLEMLFVQVLPPASFGYDYIIVMHDEWPKLDKLMRHLRLFA